MRPAPTDRSPARAMPCLAPTPGSVWCHPQATHVLTLCALAAACRAAVGWMDCVFNVIPHPHGTHVHSDTIALYPARSKSRPNYWHDLRDGDVELGELIDFVFQASANEATKKHVGQRATALGERGIVEGLTKELLGFEESLDLDERKLKPLNVTQLRQKLEKDEL